MPTLKRSIDAVLLDMGGVLVDTRHSAGFPHGTLDFRGREAMLHAIRKGGGRATEEDLEAVVFAPWRREYEQRRQRGREAAWDPHLNQLIESCRTRVEPESLLRAWFRPYGESLRPMPEARETLVALAARGLEMALVSNVPLPGPLYRERMEAWGLAEPLRLMLFSYDTGSRKPSPVMMHTALTELGIEPRRAVMVGDRQPIDVAAGLAAGTRTVWLAGGETGGPRPDLTIDSIGQLAAVLDQV